jgi:hypothetical protein
MPDNHPTVPTIWEGEFTGTPNNGPIAVNLNYFAPEESYNLIGNPYPSTLDAEAFIDANATQIDGTLYFWRKTNNAPGTAYATYTKAGATTTSPTSPVPNGIIQVGQGFIVKAIQPTNPQITFTNQQRVADNNDQFFRMNESETNRYWVNLRNENGLFSQIMVGYLPNATNEFDYGIDGKSLLDSDISFSSLLNTTPLAIQGKQLPFEVNDVVPLKFKTNIAGNYWIELGEKEGLFNQEQAIYIKDNALNITHNLSESNYTFTSENGEFNERFELVYQPSALGIGAVFEHTIVISPNPLSNQEILHFYGINEPFNCTIFDAVGKKVMSEKITNNALLITNFSTGVYIVQIKSDTKVQQFKLIIK